MTPISADELMFDEDRSVGSAKAVSADDLQFDEPGQLPTGLAFKTWQDVKDWKPSGGFTSAKELASWLKIRNAAKELGDPDSPFGTIDEFNEWLGKPRLKSEAGKRKPAQPKLKPLGELRERAQRFKPLQDPAPGYDLSLDREPGGVVLQFPKGDSFKPEGMTVAQKAPGKIKPRLTGVRREDGESLGSFLKRSEAWSQSEKARKAQERAELAQVRAKTTPSRGPIGRAAEGFKTGFGETIRTAGVGASLLTGQEPDAVALEQPLPTIGTEDAKGWLSKGGQGLGSMAGFLMTSPALGPMGATLMGAAQNAGQTYEEARARGVNHDESLAAAVPGALIGALEGIGGGGGTATGFVKGTLGEAGQEGLSQVLNNINAKFLSGYDPKRAITEGVIESAVLGGFLGAGVHGVGAALTGQPPVVPTEPMAPQLAAIPKANPSFISNPTERQANLQAWHEGADPRLKGPDGQPIAVYHGTQSPAEIEQLDMSKLDPNALYGPGFYMTQDPEVAAGEEGYASTKFYTSPSDLQTEMNKIAQEYRDHGRSEEDIKTTLQIPIQQEAEDRLTQRSSPHAYKLYANIQKPFDIDGPVPGQALEKFYEELGYLPRAQDAKAFYDSLVKTLGDKAKANEWLKRAGFDGITHIGGGLARQYSKMFSSENEAQEYARKIGVSDSAIEQVIDDEGNELSQWDVKGHRVWIAFDPTQIKSATGNQGTFAKGDPRLAASLASRPVIGFRLASLEALQSPKVPEKMTPDQAAAALKGVKAEEREWLGLDAVVDRARQEGRSVTKAELQKAIQDNQIELTEQASKADYAAASRLWKQTRPDRYEAPIGFGDTAIILASPDGSAIVKYRDSVTELSFDTLEEAMFYGLPEGYRQQVGLGKGLQYEQYDPWTVPVSNPREIMFQVNQGGQNIAEGYQASHFGDGGKGLMAHARVWDGRVGGRRSLMLGEVQSDLHQAGKQRGYSSNKKPIEQANIRLDKLMALAELQDTRGLTTEEQEEYSRLYLEHADMAERPDKVPDAPFKQTWPDLILKRMVMYASEKGYDQIVWPRGEAHAELYYPGRTEEAPGIYAYLYDKRLPGLAREWAKKYGAEYELGPEGHVLRLGPKLKEIASPGGKGLPMFSFTSDQLLEMEARAAQAGRPVALRPVTVQSFHQQIGAINQELMRVDPTSPEFARLADRAVQLRRAVEEAPTPADLKDGRTMREWARKQNMWHDTAAQDLLDMLGITDESGTDTSLPGIKTNWDLYHRRVKSGERGARFYPLPANNNKGGTVFLSPQSMVDAGVIEAEEVGKIGGMNVSLNIATDYARLAELGGHVDVAVAIRGAIREAQEKGLPKIALAMYVPGQGLKTTKQFLRHESFHTGQQVAANAAAPPESVGWNDPTALVSTELLYHPIVAKVARTEGGQSVLAYYDGDQSALAFEMAAYAAAKQYNELGWTKEEADEYLADYLLDVLETSGVEALEGLAKGARLSAPVAQQVAKLTEDHYGRERQRRDRASSFAASLRAPSATVGPEGAAGEGGGQAGEVGEGGAAQGGVEGKVDGVSEEQARDYGELDADDLEWDEDDVVDPVEAELRSVYEKATQEVPPTPPPTDPAPVAGSPQSPLTETVVAKDRYAQLREKLMQAAVAKGYKWDLAVPPGLQLAKAIKAGYLDMDNMTEMLAQAGMTVADLADLAEFTQHRAGQILNELSKITKEIDDLIDTNPQLASLIIGPNKVMQRGLKKLEATELGHSIWERAGSIMRKNFLSGLATAFTQVWSTTAQVPLDIASGAIAGLGMRFLNPAKWQHNTTGMLATAKEDVVRGIEPVLALARGMNPAQIADLLRWQKPAKQTEYKKIVDDLSLIYPEIYGKLHGREDIVPGSEGYTSPAALRQVLTQVKDPALRREYEVKLRTLEGREKFNKSLRGKVLKGYENALDVILMPLSIQEYAFRRPMFVGALQRELEARGLDLNDFIANPQKVAGARDMLQAAVDEALRFTWAYEPKAGNKALGQFEQALEGMGHYFIKYWNKAGPIGATLEAFPRALTNGLKFAYEWSPLGFLSPAWQAQDKMRHGARDQITFQESQRMAQAVVGTMMYAVALGLREWAGGEEWWQLKTGKKNKDGKPIYYDVRRIPQLAFFLNAADLAKRASEDTLGDIKVEQRLKDTYLGARRNSQPGDLGAIDQFMLMWTGDTVPTNAKQKSKLAAGQWASTFVIPLSNIRDAWAQFSIEEGAKRDLRENPWLGPSMDKLPWIRRKLSLAEGPFEPSPQLGAYAPLAEGEGLGPVTGAFALGGAIGATRMTPGQSFAAREFARLGLSPYTWLKRDPDPTIDRAQWKRMTTILQAVGEGFARNPGYLSKTPDQQRSMWEGIMLSTEDGPGAAEEARNAGLDANPREADRRKELKSNPPYKRKELQLDKLIPPVGQP